MREQEMIDQLRKENDQLTLKLAFSERECRLATEAAKRYGDRIAVLLREKEAAKYALNAATAACRVLSDCAWLREKWG